MKQVCFALAVCLLCSVAVTGDRGGKAQYLGGTVGEVPDGTKGRLITVNETFLVFDSRKSHYMVPWDSINLLEYGQKVSRRYVEAVIFSPILLLAKKRQHFLTIGFADEEGRQQALIFKVGKRDIREMLVCLEARSNLNVEYQDDDARRSGMGS